MRFEWDERKAAQNIVKHGVLFEYAARVFLDPHRLDSEDTRLDYREERRITVRLHHARRDHAVDIRAEGKPARTKEVL